MRREDAYAIVLTLIAMPLIVAFAALVIDGSRVHNLHSDLQHAVDAMALSGARELDGRDDAITRANAAMVELNQNEAWFGAGGAGMSFGSKINVTYDSTDVTAGTVDVYFLTGIPASDDTRLAGAALTALTTADSNEAKYVLVRAKPQSLVTMFPLPILGQDTLNVSADAVATYEASACDITPLFICNPVEPEGGAGEDDTSFNESFANGSLYGSQFKLQMTGSSSPGPGNFGFLRTVGSGANVLANALAKGTPGVCYRQEGLDTEPGANVGPVVSGINTRMGLYGGSFGSSKSDPDYRPDKNIRMGQSNPGVGNSCKIYSPETDHGDATPFPDGQNEATIGGGSYTDSNWDLNFYWEIAHGDLSESPTVDDGNGNYVLPEDYVYTTTLPAIPSSSYPGAGVPATPSRYDVYNYELTNEVLIENASPNGETGESSCHASPSIPSGGRRVIFAAVVNCIEKASELQGAATDIQAAAFVRMFMTKPAIHEGFDKAIFLEIIDVTGEGGLGTVEDVLREESVLVR